MTEKVLAGNKIFFLNRVNMVDMRRRVMVSKKMGYMIMGPDTTRVGDGGIILGCDMPVILRQCDGRFQIIGTYHVHGLMQGEILNSLDVGEMEVADLELQ